MMTDAMTPAMLTRLAAAAVHAGNRATAARIDDLAGKVAMLLPDAQVSSGVDSVQLSASGLLPRMFGSRRRGPDPQLVELAQMAGGRR